MAKSASSLSKRAGDMMNWLDDRLPVPSFWNAVMTGYQAPKNFNFWYYMGSLALLVLVMQIGTGIFLTMWYKPSAAEAFAYTLKHLDRATIVGEATLGMAHPSEEEIVNDSFRVSVPFMRSENVVTGTNWEKTGVIPQIEVPADRAIEAAIEDALRRIGDDD